MSTCLVLLHGYPFDRSLWNEVVGFLPNELQVLAPDLPGFGQSPVLDLEPSMDALAEHIRLILDRENIDRIVLGGMSMGGYVALAFAERFLQHLAGLALISTQAVADSEEARNSRRQLIEKIRKEGPDIAAQAIFPKLFTSSHADQPELQRHPRDGARNSGVKGLTWALEAMARRPDRTALLEQITIPSIVVHGAEDTIINTERARSMAGKLKNSRFVLVENAAHATPLEAPQAVAEALLALVRLAGQEEKLR